MKFFISNIFLFTTALLFGQTSVSPLNWTTLTGKWECVKATRLFENKTKDISKRYKSYYCNFFANFNYHDEFTKNASTKIIVDGKYKIDKAQNSICYSDLIETTRFSGNVNEDQAQQIGKPHLEIIRLSDEELILFFKEGVEKEEPGDYSIYFKKISN